MSPNEQLMDAYGTREVYEEKQAGAGDMLGRVALALLAMKAIDSFHRGMTDAKMESEMRAQMIRQNQAPGMGDVDMRMRYSRPPVFVAPSLAMRSPEQVALGYQMGVMPDVPLGMDSGMVRLASVCGEDMAKHAFVMNEMRMPTNAHPLVREHIEGFNRDARQFNQDWAAANAKFQAGRPSVAPPASAPAAKPGLLQRVKQKLPTLPGQGLPKSTPTIAAAPAAAAMKPITSAVAKKPLIGFGTKALGLGAAALGAYGLMKGTQAAANVMSEENTPTDWGHVQHGAPQLAYGVNQHGYAQRGTPFIG